MVLWTLFREGGFPMFFVVGFGAIALGAAFWHALRPDARHEGFIKWMSAATLAAVLNGFCSDLATVARFVAEQDMAAEQRTRILLQGFAESMSPGILGFAFLALVALLTAIGRRRLDVLRGA
jgi:uncharacterized membrane protein